MGVNTKHTLISVFAVTSVISPASRSRLEPVAQLSLRRNALWACEASGQQAGRWSGPGAVEVNEEENEEEVSVTGATGTLVSEAGAART